MLRSSTPAIRPPAGIFVLALAIFATFGLATAALAQDQVGVYWDAAYSEVVTTTTVPAALTGYVVLHDPTGTGGVLGWEACFAIDGPASFGGWDFQGQAINVGTEPCVAVGYASPLPASSNILLGTFQFIVTGDGPIDLSMKPAWTASLPGQMSYIPGDDPEALIAMVTATGVENVAGVNGGNPYLSYSHTQLDFGAVPIGQNLALNLVVTNIGDFSVPMDLSVTNLCDFFTLPNGDGPVVVPANGTLVIPVVFAPVQERQVFCELSLGPNMPVIGLTGSGIAPVTSWLVIGNGSCGSVNIGSSVLRNVSIRNTGQTVLHLAGTLRDSCPAFELVTGSDPVELAPGATRLFSVRFAPTEPGAQECWLDVGDSRIPDIRFVGTGVVPQPLWSAPTSYNFLSQYVGVAAMANLAITNIGTVAIPLHASLPLDCAGFQLTGGGGVDVNLLPGQTFTVQVRFLAAAPGHFQCALDLGAIVPAIQLSADAVAGPNSLVVAPSQLVFPNTLVGLTDQMDVIITNAMGFDVSFDAQLGLPSTGFSLTAGGPRTLAPGASHTVSVSFAPTAEGPFATALILGGPHPLVPIQGTGFVGSADCRIEPTSLSFGEVALGASANRQFTVFNDGATAMMLDPQSLSPAFLIDAVPGLLAPGQSRIFTVAFHPVELGPVSGVLTLGDDACNVVGMVGSGVINPAYLSITPAALDFGTVPVNTIVDRDIVVANNGPYVLAMDVQILEPTLGFSLVEAGGQWELGPGDSRAIRVRFICLTEQSYATVLALGPGLPQVPLSAAGVVNRPDCELGTAVLNFGPTPIDSSRFLYVAVSNNTDAPLDIAPSSLTPAFIVDSTPVAIPAAGSATVAVRFSPTGVTSYAGTISLGNAVCGDIACFGQGIANQSGNENLLGIYFDNGYYDNFAYTYAPAQVVEGYLVMSTPSAGGGVLAWESRVEVTGPAVLLNWALSGQAINIGTSPDFVVGLADPLPFAGDNALLATFQCLVIDTSTVTIFRVGPTHIPSVPGQMSWVPGNDPDQLLPMFPYGGAPEVAFINAGGPLGIVAPTPLAQLLGQQVDLSWPVPAEASDGCHVYRRLPEQSAVRLTNAPIQGDGERLAFTDVVTGLAPGSEVFYSYAIVRGGDELARSAEVSVKLPDLPAAATRLLPNVPNPFNPMTEIRFELGRSQHLSLRIYDVTGRLVRELENSDLAAGPYSRIWQGRDDSGRQVPSGAYYVRLVTDTMIDSRKILLLK